MTEQEPIRLPEHWVSRGIWQQFESLQHNPQVIILKGMRRCGKSSFMVVVLTRQSEALSSRLLYCDRFR